MNSGGFSMTRGGLQRRIKLDIEKTPGKPFEVREFLMKLTGMAATEFSLYDHQEILALDLSRLTALAGAAWPLVLATPGPEEPVLPDLLEVEVSFITDGAIAKVHDEFLEDPTPTDVITFAHGEILISTETAIRQAAEHGQTPEREVALYLIHGLLHLNGHEDESETGFATMKRLQEGILDRVWPD